MTLRPLRLLTVALAVFAVVAPAAGTAATTDLTVDKGIVQSVGATQIELRALDGTVVSFAVAARTRIRVNGVPARLSDIRPGYVATVTHNGSRPAVVIRAFGKAPLLTSRGIVTSLTRGAITLDTGVGTDTITLGPGTIFRFRGAPVARRQARPGATVVVRYRDGAPAKSVNVVKRAPR